MPAVSPGSAFSAPVMRLLESLGFYSGLGAVIVFMAAVALGRLARAAQPRGHGTVYPGRESNYPA